MAHDILHFLSGMVAGWTVCTVWATFDSVDPNYIKAGVAFTAILAFISGGLWWIAP